MIKEPEWSLLKQYRGKIISIVTGNLVANLPRGAFTGLLYLIILSLSVPVLNGGGHNYQELYNFYFLYAAAFLVYILFTIFGQINNYVKSYTISTDLRLKLGEKLRRLSLGYFKNNDPGDVTSRMLHDVNRAEDILSHNLPDLISGIIVPVLLGIFLGFINLELAGILFSVVIISAVFFVAARRIIKEIGKKHLSALHAASSKILEYIRTIKPLKAFDMTGERFVKLDEAMIDLKKRSFQSEVFAGIPVQIALLILDVGYLFMLVVAISFAVDSVITIPELFTFVILGFYFFEPIKNLGITTVLLRHAGNSTDRIEELFKTSEPEYSSDEPLPSDHRFSFEDVRFSYNKNEVLKGINCNIPSKSMTALVGLSGSGKTTMTNLIARFWDINSGKIKYGNSEIGKINPDLLLKNISMVFQDIFLFNDSVINNIRVGRKDATDEDVMNAAKMAKCHDFIEKMPKDYNTIISEGGKTLSGGEKQRISIARAILKDAPVVLLDEATASLDPENENDIQEALNNLVENKTLIVIAHKFNTIENAGQILVLDKGTIAETGQHDDLIKKDGLYNRLWKAQQKAGTWKMKEEI